MTASETKELYTWLSAGWPTTIRPGAPEEFVTAKLRQLCQDFGRYDYDLVMEAVQNWRRNNEKFPNTKNIINEIMWLQARKRAAAREADPDDAMGWPMEIVYADGHEACYGVFTREQFVNHPKNPDHLEPEEWHRRFMKRRQQIYERQRRGE